MNMLFSNKKELINDIHSNAIVNKRDVKITKNDKRRVHAKCLGDDCEWKIHALNLRGESTFQIRLYETKHSCPESFHVRSLKSGYQFKNDPTKKVSAFKEDLGVELGINITHDQVYNCKKLALKSQLGDVELQYRLLWDYAAEIKRTNPGSTVLIGVDQTTRCNRFDRIYICLRAVREGFLIGCRPLIGVDGCHPKGSHKGILLSVVGVDPNNNMYPVAYVVVSKENNDTWEWFLGNLKGDLDITDDSIWTFISDKQKGLVQDFQSIFPNASHRFCVRHLHGNMRNAGFRGNAFKIALYKASKSTTMAQFNNSMIGFRELSKSAVQWLTDKPPLHWSRSHFNEVPKCAMVMNNLCESYNSSILPARELPILSMLEWLMTHLMKRFQINRDRANRGRKWQKLLCPKIQKEINEMVKHIGSCVPLKSSDAHYQVRCKDGTQKWQLTGIPCVHAIRAIYCQGKRPEDFTNALYRVDTYRMVYDHCIMPMNGRSEWQPTGFTLLLPPIIGRQAGRPKKSRKRETNEHVDKGKKKARGKPIRAKREQTSLKCSKCGQPGHNKRGCKNPPIESEGASANPTTDQAFEEASQEFISSIPPSTASQGPDGSSQVINPQETNHVFKKGGKSFVTTSNLGSYLSKKRP